MEIFDGRYYQSCKRFMLLCGLWPYQDAKKRFIYSIIFNFAVASLAVPQLILLIQKCGKDVAVTFENTVSIMFSIGVCAKYLVTYKSKGRLSLLLEQVSKDWQRLTDRTEREILIKNSEEGLFLLNFYTYYICAGWVLYTLMPFLPVALDIILPLNESRPVLMPFYANYIFIDQVDYHYWSCLHIAIVYLGPLFLFSGIDTTYVITVKHTCGLFEIVCHRLENMLQIKEGEEISELVGGEMIVNNLKEAIQLHNESISCYDLLEDSFNLCFFLVNCMSVLGLALAMVYILWVFRDFFKLIRIVAFVIGLIIHLLYLNYVGQQIIDSSEQVFYSAYFNNWYLIATKSRKFLNVVLLRSITPCMLTAGKLANLCMENFGILMKTSMSYFTVILSVSE